MEKFQIARYALMQVTALVYGIFSCGATAKIARMHMEHGSPMPAVYLSAVFYRNYGIIFFLIIIIWTACAAYFSSPLSEKRIDERWMIVSGIALFFALFIVGSFLAFGTAVSAMLPHYMLDSL